MRKRLPPFGKQFRQHPKCNDCNIVFVAVGNEAWGWAADAVEPTLALPPSKLSSDFIWPVAKCHTVIVRTSEIDPESERHLAAELLQAGAISVTAPGIYGSHTEYRAEVRHGRDY